MKCKVGAQERRSMRCWRENHDCDRENELQVLGKQLRISNGETLVLAQLQ